MALRIFFGNKAVLVGVSGVLAATEAPDVVAIAGNISEVPVTGSLSAFEGRDTALFTVEVQVVRPRGRFVRVSDDYGFRNRGNDPQVPRVR